jgi:hypothetical protein
LPKNAATKTPDIPPISVDMQIICGDNLKAIPVAIET